MKCIYVPDAAAEWFPSAGFENYTDSPAWRNGSYYYGNRVEKRDFELKCYFEEISMADREKIRRWLDRNTEGWLIFDARPFIRYKVRPSKTVPGQLYTIENYGDEGPRYTGTFTVTLTAYEQPFGEMMYDRLTGTDTDHAADYCCILPSDFMPADPTTSSREIFIYHPGTEQCGLVINIGGVATNGLTIENKTNGTKCVLKSLPENGYLSIDSEHGMISVVYGDTVSNGFAYHSEGYIRLEPSLTRIDVAATKTNGSKNVSVTPYPDDSWIGKYIRLDGVWKKITAHSTTKIAVSSNASASGTENTKVVDMNDITISTNGVTLTTLEYSFIPKIF